MSADSNTPYFSDLITVPTLVLIASAIAGYFTYQPELQSLRPRPRKDISLPTPPSPPTLKARYSRLWEDPFNTTKDDGSAAENASKVPGPCPEPGQQEKPTAAEIIEAHARNLNDKSRARRAAARAKAVAAAREKENEETETECEEKDEISAECRDRIAKDIFRPRLLVLPVMVPGGPTLDDAETRRRMQYALHAALATSGFRLAYPQRMTHAPVCVEVPLVPGLGCTPVRFSVPMKLYSPDIFDDIHTVDREVDSTGFSGVLVLWINETQLGMRPLGVLSQILDNFLRSTCCDNYVIRMIGPSSSDTLLTIAREVYAHKMKESSDRCGAYSSFRYFRENDPVVMFSPRATLSTTTLKNPFWLSKSKQETATDESKQDNQESEGGMPYNALEYLLGLTGETALPIRCARTIGTDRHLHDALKQELELRGAWPNGHHECMLIITESDSSYGRGFPLLFRDLAESDKCADENDGLKRRPKLQVFRYLRGLDGFRSDPEDPSLSKAADSDRRAQQPITIDYAPTGRAQFDYLRRLDDAAFRLDKEFRDEGGRGVTCVAIIATDTYDKLLILRSLRGVLPNAVFCTTDLDAQLLAASESRWTQNLLVASHFGLSLHPHIQRDTPTFRDSYQTSLYFSSLLAVRDQRAHATLWNPGCSAEGKRLSEECLASLIRKDDSPEIKSDSSELKLFPFTELWSPDTMSDYDHDFLSPLVFEIGRSGAFQLLTHEVSRADGRNGDSWTSSTSTKDLYANTKSKYFGLSRSERIHPPNSVTTAPFSRPSPSVKSVEFVVLWILALAATGVTLVIYHSHQGAQLLAALMAMLVVVTGTIPLVSFLNNGVSPWHLIFWGLSLTMVCYSVVVIATGATLNDINHRWKESLWTFGFGALVFASFVVLIVLIVLDSISPSGEPFRLAEGISIWPGTILRVVSSLLSIALFLRAKKTTNHDFDNTLIPSAGDVTQEDIKEKIRNIEDNATDRTQWHEVFDPFGIEQKQAQTPGDVCVQYFRAAGFRFAWKRILLITAVVLALVLISILALSPPKLMYRGEFSRRLSWGAWLASVMAVTFLYVYIVDSLEMCGQFIVHLRRNRDGWGARRVPAVDRDSQAYAVSAAVSGLPDRLWLLIRMIGERSKAVQKTAFYPVIILILIWSTHWSVFDYSPMTITSFLFGAGLIVSLVVVSFVLRQRADDIRKAVLREFESMLYSVKRLPVADRDTQIQRLEYMVGKIEAYQTGAFQPLQKDWIFRYVVFPFSGVGGVTMLLQLM